MALNVFVHIFTHEYAVGPEAYIHSIDLLYVSLGYNVRSINVISGTVSGLVCSIRLPSTNHVFHHAVCLTESKSIYSQIYVSIIKYGLSHGSILGHLLLDIFIMALLIILRMKQYIHMQMILSRYS